MQNEGDTETQGLLRNTLLGLKTKADEEILFQLIDMEGKLVSDGCSNAYSGFNELKFNTTTITSGVYMLKIMASGKVHFEKVVKI